MKNFFILPLVLLLAGCAQSVLFVKPSGTPITEPGDIVRLYVDQSGSLYPPSSVGLGYWDMTKPYLRKRTLQDAFRRKNTCNEDNGVWPLYEQLCAYWNSGTDDDWLEIQKAMWQATAADIQQRALSKYKDEGIKRPVIILVHGYNNKPKEASASYQQAREKFQASEVFKTFVVKAAPVYVDVYWDGRITPLRTGIGAWRYGQPTAASLGFNLRQLLNGIAAGGNDDIPVRVITHSSGGIALAAAMGNTTPVFGNVPKEGKCEDDYVTSGRYCQYENLPRYRENPVYQNYAVPALKDYRVALLAAATPSSSFTGKENGSVMRAGVHQKHGVLILAKNEKDSALNKSFGISIKCDSFGVSCLGAGGEHYASVERHVANLREEGRTNLRIYGVVFDTRGEHDFGEYLKADGMNEVMEKLFAPLPDDTQQR